MLSLFIRFTVGLYYKCSLDILMIGSLLQSHLIEVHHSAAGQVMMTLY